LTPEQLEQALFQKFLDVRFQTFRTMQNAAKYWLAHMDQFLMTNKYLDFPDETSPLLKKIDQLTDIFYSALDADKNGEKVCFPHQHVYET
jgi:RNA-dependent RNA polymerase